MKQSEIEEIALGNTATFIVITLIMAIVVVLISFGLMFLWGELAGLPMVW